MDVVFKKTELTAYGLPECGVNGVELIDDSITDTSRWSIHHSIIFRWTDGKTYRAYYSESATECQDESPWEYDDDVECEEVAEVPVTTTEWQTVIERGVHVYEAEYPGEGSYCLTEAEFPQKQAEAIAEYGEDIYVVIEPAVHTKSGWHAPKLDGMEAA